MLFSVYGRWRFRTRTHTRWVRGKLSGSRISRCVSNRKWEYSGVNKCDSAPLMLPESLSVYTPRQSRGQFGFIWSTSLLIPGVSRVERDMRSIWRASDPYKYTAKADWRVREEGGKKSGHFQKLEFKPFWLYRYFPSHGGRRDSFLLRTIFSEFKFMFQQSIQVSFG